MLMCPMYSLATDICLDTKTLSLPHIVNLVYTFTVYLAFIMKNANNSLNILQLIPDKNL